MTSHLKVLHTEPYGLVLFRSVCAYCTNVNTGVEYVVHTLGILCCDDHWPLAKRDVRAYLYRCKKVNYADVIQEPLFAKTDLLNMDIKVRRSSGVIEDGWKLRMPSYGNRCLIRMDESGDWYMIATFDDDKLVRGVNVRDFKMVLPVSDHGLVDDFIERLAAGFYKLDQEAYEVAVVAAEAAENPTTVNTGEATAVATVADLPIFTANHHTLGIGRVLIVPSVTGAAPAPSAEGAHADEDCMN